jgi:hypothetical protein
MTWWMWLIAGFFGVIVILLFIGREKMKQDDKERKEAENFILNSGDPEAIKTMMLARAVPEKAEEILAQSANKDNTVLKTALGVTAGVVAGNLVGNAIAGAASASASSAAPEIVTDQVLNAVSVDSVVDLGSIVDIL